MRPPIPYASHTARVCAPLSTRTPMQFWQHVTTTAGLDGSFHWVLAGVIAAALALFVFLPRERPRVRAAVFLFVLAMIGLLVGGVLLGLGLEEHPAYLTIRGSARFLVAVAIVNLAGVFVFGVALPAVRLEAPRIMQDLLVGIAYIVIALVVLTGSGVDLRGIVATSAVITAVIGFSLQDTLGNIMGGMAVQMERTIRVGDWIRVGEIEGRVMQIRWRQTSIETREWDTVVIPNSVLMKGAVTLLGRRTGQPVQRRRWVYFNVDFRRAPTEVIHTVESALLAEPIDCVAPEPRAHCIVTALTESYATYAARYWLTDMAVPDPIDSLVRTRIFSALRRAGIPLSIPAHAIFVTEDDATNRDRKRQEQMERRIAALAQMKIFRSLTDAERQQLAPRLKGAPFVEGEMLTQQGAQAHWLYIMVDGEADVHVTVDGKTKHVATLHGGDYFGEMGMMTGEPRSSTVVAKTDVKCYRLGKDDFEDIIHRRPEILEDIAHTIVQRRMELDTALEEVSAEARAARAAQSHSALLSRIRGFFGLGNAG